VARRRAVLVSHHGPNGSAFIVVDPARKTRESIFDQTRLAPRSRRRSGGRVEGNRLPFTAFELSKDNRSMTCRCRTALEVRPAAVHVRRGGLDRRRMRGAENSSVSPDGKLAAYIKDYNLWLRDLATGKETQLTTDGIKDFGYATDNAGWAHSDRPVLTWSPDSKQIATFQHDGRGVRDMFLVSTNVGPRSSSVEVSDAGGQRDLPHQPGDHSSAA
jgi:hypothetical protein